MAAPLSCDVRAAGSAGADCRAAVGGVSRDGVYASGSAREPASNYIYVAARPTRAIADARRLHPRDHVQGATIDAIEPCPGALGCIGHDENIAPSGCQYAVRNAPEQCAPQPTATAGAQDE